MNSDLQALIIEATRYARFTMKKCGCLSPVMMAATDQGTILFTPDKLSDFANKVRLITASYGASAVVLILESWITKAKADEPLDTLTPPSESYDREEVVVLIGQAPQGNIIVSVTANSGTWVMLKTCPQTALKDGLPAFFHPSSPMMKHD